MAVISERFDTLGLEDPSKQYRLGIMGGTFDPIHIGHLACAEQVRDGFGLDAVLFIPAGNPAFKRHQYVSPAEMRLEMCRLACASNPLFDVSDIEVKRSGTTYTVDTLRAIREHYPSNVELFFITGADAMLSILKWKDSVEISHVAQLIAVTRPGYLMSDESKQYLRDSSDFAVSYMEVTALSISSSDLRERVAKNSSIRYLTMQSVFDYIHANKLYQES